MRADGQHERGLTEHRLDSDRAALVCDVGPRPEVRFIRQLFANLSAAAVDYAVLHGAHDLERTLASDIDIALGESPTGRFVDIVQATCKSEGFRIANILHYEIPEGFYFILVDSLRPGSVVHLDCLYDPIGVNTYSVPTPFLLEDAMPVDGVQTTREDRRAAYLLMKRAIKRQSDPERISELRDLLRHHGAAVAVQVHKFSGCAPDVMIDKIARSATDADVVHQLESFRRRMWRAHFMRQPIRIVHRHMLDVLRQLGRLLRPTGFFVVLVGPDGCGKSTVSEVLPSYLERGFRRISRFHWRPGLLPKLGRSGRQDAGTASVAVPPLGVSRYGRLVSSARLLYYSLDFILGYWLRVYPQRVRTGLIVGERYFPDVCVNPARYGFAAPSWLIRLVAKLVPNPDLTVLLVNDPEVIRGRKPELPVPMIAAQLQKFHTEMLQWGEHMEVRTDEPAPAVAERIALRILRHCGDRALRNVGRVPSDA